MRKCPHCGKPLNPDALFCGSCGKQVPPSGPTPPKKRIVKPQSRSILIAAVAALVVVIVGVIVLMGKNGSAPGGPLEPGYTPTSDSEYYEAAAATFDDNNYYAQVDESHYATDEETSHRYVDNEILVYAKEGAATQDVKTDVASLGGEIVGYIHEIEVYQVRFDKTLAAAEIVQKIQDAMKLSTVFSAYPHFVSELEVESEEQGEQASAQGTSPTQDDVWSNDTSPDTRKDGTAKPQWLLRTRRWAYDDIHLSAAWDLLNQNGIAPGSGVHVGIIDNMFYAKHSDLDGRIDVLHQPENLKVAADNKRYTHGTHVVGIIGAGENNGVMAGIAYASSMTGIARHAGTDISQLAAFAELIGERGAKVINFSMGDRASNPNDQELPKRLYEPLRRLAANHEFLICKAAGNYNLKDNEEDAEPNKGAAAYDEVIGLTSLEFSDDGTSFASYFGGQEYKIPVAKNDILPNRIIVVGNYLRTRTNSNTNLSPKPETRYLASDSNGGDLVTIAAPGTEIYSCLPESLDDSGQMIGNGGGFMDGTSMAAPMVSGVAALVWSACPDLTAEEVKQIIVDSAVANGACGYMDNDKERITAFTRLDGYPVLDAEGAVKMAFDKKAEKEAGAHHAKLREDAVAAGKQVFEGVLHICTADEAADMLGTRDALDSLAKQSSKTRSYTYALLQLNETKPVYVKGHSIEPTTRDSAYIMIGQNRSIASEQETVSQWKPYDGKYICVSVNDFWIAEGVDIVNVPKTDNADLLYSSDGTVAASTETAPANTTQEEPYDPTWYTKTDTTFETQDFIVTVPDDWAGQWNFSGPQQDGENYVWTFIYTPYALETGGGGPIDAGGGIVVTPSSGEPSGQFSILEQVSGDPSSRGNYLWFMNGAPLGFFSGSGNGPATVTLK